MRKLLSEVLLFTSVGAFVIQGLCSQLQTCSK